MDLLGIVRDNIKTTMTAIARVFDKLSGGRLTPNMVTVFGLLAHLPIAYLIATRHIVWAGVLLIIFGLFDALDGALARLQKKTSAIGMFIDSSTDRMKEILLYCGMAVFFLNAPYSDRTIIILIAALGVSLLTSYLNAWGEVVLSYYNHSTDHKINKTFRSGLMGLDLRILVIIIGLLSGKLSIAICVILILGSLTVIRRFTSIINHLKHV